MRRLRESNPGSIRCRSRKLRNISPEPTNNTNESATSTVTTALRMALPVPSPVLRLMPRSTFIRRGREARSAGVMPKRIAPASPASAVKASTDGSMVIVSRRGRSAGASERSSLIPAQASASPARVPKPASQTASAMIGDINLQRLAPSAARTASSRLRSEARTSRRLATFAHATSRRKMTEPMRARIAGRTSAIRCWRIGSTRMWKSAVPRIGNWARSEAATFSDSA